MGSFAAGRYAEGTIPTGVNLSRPVPHSRSRPAAGVSWFYIGLFAAGIIVLVGIATFDKWSLAQRPVASNLKLADIPVDGERAYGYLKDICAIGPRVCGTDGMQPPAGVSAGPF